MSFFLVIDVLLVQHGIVVAFAAAILTALLIQGVSLRLSRRLRAA